MAQKRPFQMAQIERELFDAISRGEGYEYGSFDDPQVARASDIMELITVPRGYSQSTEAALAEAGYNPSELIGTTGASLGTNDIMDLLTAGLGEKAGITGALEDRLEFQPGTPDERTKNARARILERLAAGETALEDDPRSYAYRRAPSGEDDAILPFSNPDEGSRQVGPDTVTSGVGALGSRDTAPGSALPEGTPTTQRGTGVSPETEENREGFWSQAKSILTGERIFDSIYDFVDRSLLQRDEREAERDLRDVYEDVPEPGVSTAGPSPVLGGALDREAIAAAEAEEAEARQTLSELLEQAVTDDEGNRSELDPDTLPTLLNFIDRLERRREGGMPFIPEGEELGRFAEDLDLTQTQVDSLVRTQELTRELGLDEEREPGALVQFLEQAGRGLYGLAGAASGDTDQIERTEEERDMNVLELAGSRALEGFANERQFTSRDVTGLVDTSDMNWLPRAGWAVSHFAMDVAADPVSYITLGGAGMSRRTLSEAVERSVLRAADDVGRSELTSLSREGQERLLRGVGDDIAYNQRIATAVRDEVVGPVGSGARRASRPDAVGRRAAVGERAGIDASEVDEVLSDPNLSRLDVLDALEGVGGTQDLRRQLLQEGLRNNVAGAFQKGGATGLRRNLAATFGDDSVYRAFDKSLQGGFQLTVPFASRQADFGRRAVTAKPRSEALGRAAQAAATFYNKRRLQVAASQPGQAFQHIFGGKNRNEVKRLTQMLRYGDDETVGAAWAQYAAMRDAKILSAEAARAASTRARGVFYTASNHLLGANDPDAAKEALRTVWASKSGLVDEATGRDDLGRQVVRGLGDLDEVDVRAGRAAFEELDALVRQVGEDAREATGDAGRAMNLLNNYAPRRIRDITEEMQSAPGAAGARARAEHTRARSGFGAVFEVDETSGDLVVRNWQSAPEVGEDAATGGRQVLFEDDPTEAIVSYLESMDRVLAEQNVLRHLHRRGFQTDPDVLRWLEGGADSRRVRDVLEPASQARREGLERVEAARSARALGKEERADELLGDLPDIIGDDAARQLLDEVEGFRVDYRPGAQAARSASADVDAQLADEMAAELAREGMDVPPGSFVDDAARQADEAATAAPGKWTVTRNGATREFDDWTDAVAWGEREVASDLWDSTTDAILSRLRTDETVIEELIDARVLHGMSPQEQADYIDDVTKIIGRYVDPDATTAKTEGALFSKDPAATRYAKRLAEAGWDREDAFRPAGELAAQGKDPAALDRQALIAAQQEGLFRPSAHAESLARIGRTQSTSSDEYGQWFIDKIWQPYYTTFKTLATVGRGPGFSIRNALGGAHNAYIAGARASHFRNTEKMIRLEHAAKRRVAKRLQDVDEVVAWADVEQMIKDEVRQSFRKGFATKARPNRGGQFYEALEQFYNRNLMTGSRTDEFTQQTMLSGRQESRSVSRYAGGPGAAGMGEIDLSGPRWARVLEGKLPTAGSAVDEMDAALARGAGVSNTVFLGRQRDELGRMGRAVQALADNPWVRANAGLAELSEKYTRIAPFLAGLDRFGIEDGGRAAGLLVKASQFDYTDLTPEERRFLRNLMPFYTFSRFNIPFQVRGLVMEPHVYAKLGHGWEAAQDAVGVDDRWREEIFPRWVRDNMGEVLDFAPADVPGAAALARVPVLGGMFESQHPIALNLSSLPAMDLNKLFEVGGTFGVFSDTAQDELLSMINPMVKTPIEQVAGIDSFTRSAIPEREQLPDAIQDNVVGDLAEWLPGVSRDGSGNLSAPSWVTRGLRQTVPPIGQAERLLGTNERYRDRQLTSVLSNMAGAPVSTLDAPQLRANATREQQRLLGLLREWAGDRIPGDGNDGLRALVESDVPPEVILQAHERGQLPELVQLVLDRQESG